MWGSRYKDVNALIGFLWGLQIGVHFVSKPDGTTSYRIAVVMEDDSILLIQQNGEDVPPWMWVSISRRYWSLLTSAGSVLEYTGLCLVVLDYTGICKGSTGVYWHMQECSRVYWHMQECSGVYWHMQRVYWSILAYAGVYWQEVYWTILAYAKVYWSILTYSPPQGQ